MAEAKKYIFVTGGVLSGVGKGITAASIGSVLQAKGLTVSAQKCDPYLNLDAGRLDPAEHGEVFVTQDGAETDLDLGHYERFLDIELTKKSTTLSGQLFKEIIEKDQAGGFGGKTVQMVPHLTELIQAKIRQSGRGSDVHIVELGGTVGDYEGLSYIEAIRELAWKVGKENCLFIHLVYIPFISITKEFKTKPAQNALRDLRSFGIVPDVVVARSDNPAPQRIAKKLALFGGLDEKRVQLMSNVPTVFQIPLIIAKSNLLTLLSDFTGNSTAPDITKWQKLLDNQQAAKKGRLVTVGVLSRELKNDDVHLSLYEALKAAAHQERVNLQIKIIDANNDFSPEPLGDVDGLIVPPGFDQTGLRSKISAARLALDTDIPYLGIGLGMQVAAIAAAQKSGIKDATSEELSDGGTAIITKMASARVGAYEIHCTAGLRVESLYGQATVKERERHQYMMNTHYLSDLARGGIEVSALSADGEIVEFIEAPDHRFFVGAQAHIEFSSRPFRPHPVISEFIKSL